MSRKDVAQVGAVQNVFKSRKDSDPDWRSVLAGNEPVALCVRSGLLSLTGENGL